MLGEGITEELITAEQANEPIEDDLSTTFLNTTPSQSTIARRALGFFPDLFCSPIRCNNFNDAAWHTLKLITIIPTGCATIFFAGLKLFDLILAKLYDGENPTISNGPVCEKIEEYKPFFFQGNIAAPASLLIGLATIFTYYMMFRSAPGNTQALEQEVADNSNVPRTPRSM